MDATTQAEISYLAGVKPSTGEKIFEDPGGEGIAILCKATGLKRAYFRQLWTALRRPDPERDPGFARVSEIYESIAVAKAQTVLRYWNWSLSAAFSPDAAEDDGDDVVFVNDMRSSDVVRGKPAFGR
jgi:hypothetical protein